MSTPIRVKSIRHRWTKLTPNDRRIVEWKTQDIGVPLAAGVAMFAVIFGLILFAFICIAVSAS